MLHSAFSFLPLALVVLSVGCGEKPTRSSKAPSPGTTEVTDSVAPEDVTEIRLEWRSGGPPPFPGAFDNKTKEIVLVREPESAKYFNRIAKAMIDNGFLKLKRFYPGKGADLDVLTITLKYRDNASIVDSSDHDIETNPTFVFECLIDCGDRFINAPRRKKE